MKSTLSSFLQWRFNMFLYRQLSWKIAFYYIIFLGTLFFFVKKEEKQKVKMAVRFALAGRKSLTEIKSVTSNVFRGMLSHYYEKLFNAFSSADELRAFLQMNMESEGLSKIDKGLSKGKGVVMITAHFGGVEFLPGYLAASGYPVTILVRFASKHLRVRSIEKAGKFSTKIIDVDNTPNIMRAVLDDLKENRVVIIQCDEMDEWRPSSRYLNIFLGKVISLDRTINILTKRARAEVVFGIIHRKTNPGGYKLVATSRDEMRKGVAHAGNTSVGTLALKLLEQYIYQYPEQWYQWKKFSDIKIIPGYETRAENATALPLLRPTFGKI